MDKLRMESPDMTAQNIERIAALFPNCITEMLDEEHSTPEKKVYKRAVNFELLKQMLSPDVVDGDEAYEFTWVGKKAAIVEANKQIRKTLRPCVAESKDWDNTENLYIEGDNLEVLKLLQESYLGKVKMIYIDPPYNTGNDFIYADDFMRSQEEENAQMGMYDEDENRLFKNTDSNGRFHSDWCSMIYSRLMLARNLLTEDGVIFISISEDEIDNLKKICVEIFGQQNYIATLVRKTKTTSNNGNQFAPSHEYIVVCAKKIALLNGFNDTEAQEAEEYVKLFKYEDEYSKYNVIGLYQPALKHGGSSYPIKCPDGTFVITPDKKPWRWNEQTFLKNKAENRVVFKETKTSPLLTLDGKQAKWNIYTKLYLKERLESGMRPITFIDKYTNSEASKELIQMKIPFDFSKPRRLIQYLIKICLASEDTTILDFFSGSATTAHAVMQLNAEDGGHRKFIMVQIPEPCDETSEAYKAGYKNICEIGKERIRRAGEKIKSEIDVVHKDDYAALVQSQQSNDQKVMTGFDSLKSSGVLTEKGYTYTDKDTKDISRITYSAENPNDFYRFHPNALDVGFRVLKLDDTNMKDVYYAPDDYDQGMLAGLESNIKDDRTDLDLLFGCLIDWGLPLSLPYKSEQLGSCTVHTYNDGDLIACFDANIPESVVKEIAQRKPLRAVFRDSGFASSPEKINVFEIFKLYMPEDAGDISKRVRVI